MSSIPISRGGFSLVEILIAIGVVGILAGIAVPLVTRVPEAAKKEKLEQDVAVVNNAIDSYLASGGEATNLTSANVISVLKTRVYGGMPAEMLGPQGPFLDPSVVTNATDFSWSAVFATSPRRPGFYVTNSTQGVIFAQGPAVAVGGVAERPDEARPSWLWTYGQAAAPEEAQAFTPLAVDALGSGSTVVPVVGVTLDPPLASPGSQTGNLWTYPLPVVLTNPNPPRSSRIYYKVGSGSFSLYDDGTALSIGPGTTLLAVCVSLDPSRYYNSTVASNFYGVIPLELAVKVNAPGSVSYAQAGGILQGIGQLQPATATITLEGLSGGVEDNLLVKEGESDRYIPPPYLQDANFLVRYTTDGSDPLAGGTVGPAFNGFFSPVVVSLALPIWGTNTSVTIRAAAISKKPEFFTSSGAVVATSTIAPTPLVVDIFPRNPVGLPNKLVISNIGSVPVGVRTFYRINGPAPLSAELGGFPVGDPPSPPVPDAVVPKASFTVLAQATGPVGSEQWFASPLASRTYSVVTVLNPDFVGANISGGDINGSFRGSIFVSAPADLGIFNAGGQIVGGNLYVPGLPEIETPGSGNSSKTVVARGAFFVDSLGLIPRTLIAGKEFSANGALADPQLDLRQIVDLDGSRSPTNYTVKLTKSTFIEGKIYRNVDVPPPPPVPQLPLGLSSITNSFSGVPAATLAAGVYSNRITMNSSSSVIRLGVAGSSAVSQYIFTGNTFTKGTVEILGPVEIFFISGWVNSGVVFGGTNTINQLRINVLGGDVDIKTGGALYASLWASNNISVGNGGVLFGSIYARNLTVAPNGTVNVE
jgi:prepilin-type N-terminal cleavage/methylation domain-containing protein